jgi:hypothetical protein
VGLKNLQGMGANYVPAYQSSGVPFVTSSGGSTVSSTPQKVTFPFVTRFFQITNTGPADLRIGFSYNGVQGTGGSVSGSTHERVGDHANYFVLGTSGSSGGGTTRLELRCTNVWVRSDNSQSTGFTLVAGLTGVKPQQFPQLTGSNGFVGIG